MAGLEKPQRPHVCPFKGQCYPGQSGHKSLHTHSCQKAGPPLSTLSQPGKWADPGALGASVAGQGHGGTIHKPSCSSVSSEANCSTSHVSPAQGPPGVPWALHKCLLLALQGQKKQDWDWTKHSHLLSLNPGKALTSLPWKEKTT